MAVLLAQVEKDEKERYDAQVAKSELRLEPSTASDVETGGGSMPPTVVAAAKAETPKASKDGKSKRPSEGKSGPKRKRATLAEERR
jgi:hypothetical protein